SVSEAGVHDGGSADHACIERRARRADAPDSRSEQVGAEMRDAIAAAERHGGGDVRGNVELVRGSAANDLAEQSLYQELHGGEESGDESEDAARCLPAPFPATQCHRSCETDDKQKCARDVAVDGAEAAPKAQTGTFGVADSFRKFPQQTPRKSDSFTSRKCRRGRRRFSFCILGPSRGFRIRSG